MGHGTNGNTASGLRVLEPQYQGSRSSRWLATDFGESWGFLTVRTPTSRLEVNVSLQSNQAAAAQGHVCEWHGAAGSGRKHSPGPPGSGNPPRPSEPARRQAAVSRTDRPRGPAEDLARIRQRLQSLLGEPRAERRPPGKGREGRVPQPLWTPRALRLPMRSLASRREKLSSAPS